MAVLMNHIILLPDWPRLKFCFAFGAAESKASLITNMGLVQ